MKKDTKDIIIATAIKAFNQQGFGAVSLHELSVMLEMSRGNLAYHFKDKDALLEYISEGMWRQIEKERAKTRQFPSFENLHKEVQLYYKFQRKYEFVFLDTHVLKHPAIRKKFRDMTQQTIQDNKAIIAFSIKTGNMKPEPVQGMYHNLAFMTWMVTFFWLPQQVIRGEKTREDGEKMIWSLLIPHFTEKGITAFRKYFGEDYFLNLGEPFEMDMSEFISF